MVHLRDARASFLADSLLVMERSVLHQFKPHARAAARARAALDASLDLFSEVLDQQRLDDLRLLTSELVSNSVRHGGRSQARPIRVRVSVTEVAVRVAVVDSGPGFDITPKPIRADDDGGWGLFLLDRLADRWGMDENGTTTVWFELDRSSPAP
jgi:anti-sigma regulatory factor (Ser/Thr protein kinase)